MQELALVAVPAVTCLVPKAAEPAGARAWRRILAPVLRKWSGSSGEMSVLCVLGGWGCTVAGVGAALSLSILHGIKAGAAAPCQKEKKEKQHLLPSGGGRCHWARCLRMAAAARAVMPACAAPACGAPPRRAQRRRPHHDGSCPRASAGRSGCRNCGQAGRGQSAGNNAGRGGAGAGAAERGAVNGGVCWIRRQPFSHFVAAKINKGYASKIALRTSTMKHAATLPKMQTLRASTSTARVDSQ